MLNGLPNYCGKTLDDERPLEAYVISHVKSLSRHKCDFVLQ